MTGINWGLAVPPDIGGTFLRGLERGQQMGRERRVQNALAEYAKNPDDPNAVGLLAQVDPRLAIQVRGQQQQAAAQAQQQKRADLPSLIRLVETATDEASYQRNRAIAQEYGIDTSNLPPNFDPAWRQQQLATMQALQDPAKMEALSTAGKVAMDMGYKPGTPEFNKVVQDVWQAGQAKPYVVGGETRLYTPRIGGQGEVAGVTEGATATNPQTGEKIQYRGGQWVPMGGGGGNVTSNFLDGL